MRTAVVVGAGIGGAAAAVALQQVGWRVIILERAQTTGEVGAGLVLRQGSCRISGFESDHTVGVWLTRE